MAELEEYSVLTAIDLVGEFRAKSTTPGVPGELTNPDEAKIFISIVSDDGDVVMEPTEVAPEEESEGVHVYVFTPTEDQYGICTYDVQGTGEVTVYGGGRFVIKPRQVVPAP